MSAQTTTAVVVYATIIEAISGNLAGLSPTAARLPV